MVNLRLSFFEYFKYSESVVSENNYALPGSIALIYFKVFLIFEIEVFKKMPKQKCMH